MSAARVHPSAAMLALFAGGDLAFGERWRMAVHLRTCGHCRAEIRGFELARKRVVEAADEMPCGFNWARLAAEMTGNIRVGLEAGQCVGPGVAVARGHRRWPAWSLTAAGLCAAGVFLAAFWLGPTAQRGDASRVSKPASFETGADRSVLAASPARVEFRENGNSLQLLADHPDHVTVSVGLEGSASARYVDSDSGQVTVNKVDYAP